MIALQKWAERFDPKPHPNTLRNWTREGRIYPAPVKIGRGAFETRHLKPWAAAA